MSRKQSLKVLATLFLLAAGAIAGQAPTQIPDTILVNGRIFTATDTHTFADAIAIQGARILAVGTNQEISALAGPNTRRIDVGGRLVIPGINDAHYHLSVEPKAARLHFEGQEPTWQDVRNELARAVSSTPKGTFILGATGAAVFESAEANRKVLDGLAPDHPVALQGWTGHYYILNSAALRMLSVPEDQRDPLGGRFVRGSDGKLTGLTLEYANFRLLRRMSELATEQEALQQTRDFLSAAARLGITSVQNMSAPVAPDRLVSLYEAAPTSIRMRIMHFVLTDEHRRITEEGRNLPHAPSPLITVSGTKYILDGTPIERSCAMRQPYSDAPTTSGWMDFTEKVMEAILRESLKDDDQLLAHIVGDRTVETFLDAMDATGGKAVWSKRRVRIEHGDGIAPDLLPRVKELGIIVVQNPTHLALRDLLLKRWGPLRTEQLQPLRSLLDAGIPVAIGSDGPFNPYLNIMLASNIPGKPKESIAREQAVIAYTRTSAYAEFAEKDKGTLEPGKFADLAVLSQDIFKVPPPELPKTESLFTLVGGKVVYSAGPLAQK
jgi:predicted amidohydrolase YtcJ